MSDLKWCGNCGTWKYSSKKGLPLFKKETGRCERCNEVLVDDKPRLTFSKDSDQQIATNNTAYGLDWLQWNDVTVSGAKVIEHRKHDDSFVNYPAILKVVEHSNHHSHTSHNHSHDYGSSSSNYDSGSSSGGWGD